MVNKYIKIYLKRNFKLALFCAIIVFLPFLTVSLIYDTYPNDILVSFAPFPLAVICFLISMLPTLRFKKMITQQEQMLDTLFSDCEAVHLETTLYLSKDWLIWAGSCAIHKRNIQSVDCRVRSGKSGSSNQVIITTADHRQYTIWCLSASNVKKIKNWQIT